MYLGNFLQANRNPILHPKLLIQLRLLNPDFQLHTQQTSKALGRGKHTTRHCQLFPIGSGWVADTPGFSSLDFQNIDILALQASLIDFKPYLGMCKFNDCTHTNEPGCAVKEALEENKISSIS